MSFGNAKAQSRRSLNRYNRDQKRIEEIAKNSHLRATVNHQGLSYEVYESPNGDIWAFRIARGHDKQFIKYPNERIIQKAREKLSLLQVKSVMES